MEAIVEKSSEAPSPLHRLALTNSQIRPDKVIPIETPQPFSPEGVRRNNSRKSMSTKKTDRNSEKTNETDDDGFKFGEIPPPPQRPPPIDSP